MLVVQASSKVIFATSELASSRFIRYNGLMPGIFQFLIAWKEGIGESVLSGGDFVRKERWGMKLARMDEERLAWDLQHAPSIRLLKADNAALIIGFLYHQFKRAQRVSVPLTELVEQLEGYLEHLSELTSKRYVNSAQKYLSEWADDDHRFVRISVYGNGDIPSVELTSDTERAIGWLEDMHSQAFVGTESRFLLIMQLLREIVQKSTEDPGERLAQLEQQRAALDEQIELIRSTGRVENLYTPTQVRERFFEASQLARQLLRDFRLVEEKFREIARAIQEGQLRPGVRKGSLVEYVLDADAELKASDQGRSFYSFWEVLVSPSQGDELKNLLEELDRLGELRQALSDDHILPRLPGYLVNAGEKIVHSNARLAEQLRRLLDEQALAENRRVQELIQEIKQEVYLQDSTRNEPGIWLELEGEPETQLVMERELWEPAKVQAFTEQPLQVSEEDLREIDFSGLYRQFAVDEMLLRQRIDSLLENRPIVHLSEVLAEYPVEKGLAEVLTYCVLAARDPRHRIDPATSEEISLTTTSLEDARQERVLILPRIAYRRSNHAE
jgi:hypothetical protein